MDTTRPFPPRFGRICRICGLAVGCVGIAALVGWKTHRTVLSSLRSSYIPMAPNTALAFLILGIALWAIGGEKSWARRFAALGSFVVGAISALRMVEYLSGLTINQDQWFIAVPAGKFGLAELGKMSFMTAVAFVATCAGVVVLISPRPFARALDAVGIFGLIAAGTGLVFSLGYLFSPNTPLLYGTQTIPMALNTALCFVGLGTGLVMAAGPSAFPLRQMSGDSVRARLLRVFLPLVVVTVVAVAWLTHVVTTSSGGSSAAIASAALATASVALFATICEQIARRVGEQLERAEDELKQAHDELEIKVEQRTAELGRSLRETRAAHESLQQAHDDLKQAQTRMLQQAKMASLGQTAAGVAHEINNPLAFVTNNLAVLKREIGGLHDILLLYQQAEQTLAVYQKGLHHKIRDLSEEVDLPYVLENLDGLLERSKVGLHRIQKIVEGLRDFAHLDEADFKEADLNAGIRTTANIMQSLAEERRISLKTDLAPIPKLTCYPAKINMMLQSLISNALDASPGGGTVMLRTRPTEAGIEFEVSDSGAGISPAIRDKIFDPFFTTKPAGKGTGLGLAITYGIVKDHGGTIEFDSIPTGGTRFLVRLPSTPPRRTSSPPADTDVVRDSLTPV